MGNAVIHFHLQHIVTGLHDLGQLKTEGRKAALMAAQLLAVAPDRSHVICALQFNILSFSRCGIGQRDLVSSLAPVIVTAAILSVKGIPGMGQLHRCKRFSDFCKACLFQ